MKSAEVLAAEGGAPYPGVVLAVFEVIRLRKGLSVMSWRQRLAGVRDKFLHVLRHRPTVPSWLTSLLVHVVSLLTLALIGLGGGPAQIQPRPLIFDSSPPEELLFATDMAVPSAMQAAATAASGAANSESAATTFMEAPTTDLAISAPLPQLLSPSMAGGISSDQLRPVSPGAKELNKVIIGESSDSSAIEARSAGDGVKGASGAADAAQGIIDYLRKDLEEGPLFIIWLLDASISLEQDRHKLATTLEPFYEDFEPQGKERSQLLSGVVAYGQGVNQIQDTSAFHTRSLHAIRSVPFDQSGTENVMTAVLQVLKRYAPRARGRLRIVIWTDESGDDTALLEDAIAACRKSQTIVHVVGPSSVLGTDRGLQPYTDRATGHTFMLPVTRGPDTCFQERLLLPYWFDASANAGIYNGFMVAEGLPWYGGALRERLMSGVGPYALTRLALQTGGTFTILDRPGESSSFDLAAMQGYFPDYGNAVEIMRQLKESPFRSAIMRAVEGTYRPVNLAPPRMRFPTLRIDLYPFTEYQPYMPPAAFRKQLTADIPEQVALVGTSAKLIEESLRNFGEENWEASYIAETSARWRAWYDLTHGRLLAMSIRHQEYLATCKLIMMPGNLSAETNAIQFVPGQELLSGNAELSKRREKAKELLNRCVASNPGTPWAMLADWELQHPMGFGIAQEVIPPPPPPPPIVVGPPSPPPAPAPVIQLPRL